MMNQKREGVLVKFNKVVLAYSGGLDTSVIVKWLMQNYGCEVVTFTADIGQGEEVEPARLKAEQLGVKETFVEDLREEFVSDYVFPMLRSNAVYEGEYLLGTSIARPLIAKRLVEIAQSTSSDAISHGATGKGNDQVRFELGIYAINPNLAVIAPWREWDLTSRNRLIAYCEENNIPIERHGGKASPYSTDANLLHISYEGDELEDPWNKPNPLMWRWTQDPATSPESGEELIISFLHGDPIAVNDVSMSPARVMEELNKIGGRNGVGRSDIVENRYVGMKARGCYETPGGTILLKARRALESIVLDREVSHLKDMFMTKYAELIYNGYWWSPERKMLQSAIDFSQEVVNGDVRLFVCRGLVTITGRQSKESLFDENIATFEDDGGAYQQSDATGFIRLNALRLKNAAIRGRKL